GKEFAHFRNHPARADWAAAGRCGVRKDILMSFGPMPKLAQGETVLIELLKPDQRVYLDNRNCVALVTSQRLIYVKKKMLGVYCELVDVPIESIREIRHRKCMAIGAAIGGVIIMAAGLIVLFAGMTL